MTTEQQDLLKSLTKVSFTRERVVHCRLTFCFIKDAETDGYAAYIKQFPGAIGQGESEELAEESARDGLRLLLKVAGEEKD